MPNSARGEHSQDMLDLIQGPVFFIIKLFVLVGSYSSTADLICSAGRRLPI